MKTPSLTTQLSIGAALVFATWIVWLWVDDAKQVKVQKPEKSNEQVVEQEIAKAETYSEPSVFVLPAPPAPTPIAEPVVQAARKVEPVKAAPKPIEEVKKVAPTPEPAPNKVVKAEPTPKPSPKPIVQKKPTPQAKPKPVPAPEVHTVSLTEAVGGRALLRVLEHGKGPQIEIAWPSNASKRDGLYRQFQTCFSMVNALMDGEGNLFRNEEPRGVRWEINMDRFSGFLRQASGALPHTEQRIMRSISKRHRNLSNPVPVRIFPRRVDASLLGGLRSMVGDGYMAARSIQAQYVLINGRVLVQDIRVDGRKLSGMIELSKTKGCKGRA